ncbi:MAG: ABC transporter substrate binding protein [Halopseudomonas sp.]
MTRVATVLLVLVTGVLAIGLQATSVQAAQTEPLKLLMVLWRGETAAEQGFLEQLKQQQVALEITRVNAQQDRNALAKQLWQLAPSIDQFDLVYSFGTTASVMTKAITRGRLPQLYSMVHNPSEAGLEPTTPASLALTGSTDAIPARQQLDVARQLFEIRRLGFLFNAREQNSRIQLEELEELCQQMGIVLEILRVAPDSESLSNQLVRLQTGNVAIDTLYLPNDSYIISQSRLIMQALQQTQYKVIGTNQSFVRDGALMALAPDFEAMGKLLALRLLELQASDFRTHLPPITIDQPRVLYNEATRQRLGIEIPPALTGKMVPIR